MIFCSDAVTASKARERWSKSERQYHQVPGSLAIIFEILLEINYHTPNNRGIGDSYLGPAAGGWRLAGTSLLHPEEREKKINGSGPATNALYNILNCSSTNFSKFFETNNF